MLLRPLGVIIAAHMSTNGTMIEQLEKQAAKLGLKKLQLARVAGVHMATWKRWRQEGYGDDDPRLDRVGAYLQKMSKASKAFDDK